MNDTLNLLDIGIGLSGGLALFLYGMRTMSDGLKAAAGEGMKGLLARLTSNRFSAAVTGAIVTAVIQSSSVTTVLVVGFISAGLMSLTQSVGVIMGANVGTTITAQIVAFNVTEAAWAMVAAGFGFWAFPRRDVVRQYGAMIMGLGLLFLGMDQMSVATNPLRTYEPFIDLMGRMSNPLLGILLGALFTALVQSSSATTGIVIMLASQGFLSLEGGIALALGANIGTCVTAVLSALGKPPEAVRAAAVHVLFNVIGVLMWVGMIGQLADAAREISPQHPELAGIERLAAETPRQVANANTLFNIANTMILIWFAGPIAGLAVKLVPARKVPEPGRVKPEFLDPVYLHTPAIGIDRVRLEIGHMGGCVVEMVRFAPTAWHAGSRSQLERLRAMDDDVDRLHTAILEYVRDLGREELTETQTKDLGKLLSIANYVEGVGDLVGTDIVGQAMKRPDAPTALRTADVGRLLWEAVERSLRDALAAVADDDPEAARHVIARKLHIHGMIDEALESLGRLVAQETIDVKTFRISADILGQIKRLYYNVRKMAQIVADQAAAKPPEAG